MAKKQMTDDDLNTLLSNELINKINISREVEESFLSYAVYTIIDRAIPTIDGMKPVHRRLLYSMYRMGLKPEGSYKKSARLTGDVIGKYHPHGDGSVYGAMCGLVNDFDVRYPLIDGHGNFGSVDGDGAAAQRYTEAKLTKLAMEMLEDIDNNGVDMVPNFSEDELEPTILPAKVPSILLNNMSGIATGYTTDLPSHNMNNVCDTIIAYLKNNNITIEEMVKKHLIGPDLPSRGYLINDENIMLLYSTGQASLRFRGKVIVNTNIESKNPQVVVTELPPGLKKPKYVEKLHSMYIASKDKRIVDLRDESEGDGISIVLELNKVVAPETIINELYDKTPLMKNKSYIMRVIIDNAPLLLNLKQIVEYYVEHRRNVIKRRSEYKLTKINEKINILNGKVVVAKDIKTAVNLIIDSESPTDAIKALIDKYSLNEEQAKAIMDIPLKTLTKLESNKLIDELNKLTKEAQKLSDILSDGKKVDQEIIKDMEYLKKNYGDNRKTQLIEIEQIENNVVDVDCNDIPQEPMFISTTNQGKVNLITYQMLEKMFKNKNLKSRNIILTHGFKCEMNDEVVVLSNKGNCFKSTVSSFSTIEPFEKEEKVIGLIPLREETVVMIITQNGLYKKIKIEAFIKMKNNKIVNVLSLEENDKIIGCKVAVDDENSIVVMASNNGKIGRFPIQSSNAISSLNSKCISINGLSDGEQLIKFDIVDLRLDNKNKVIQYVQLENGNKMIKVTPISDFLIKNRNAKLISAYSVGKKEGNSTVLEVLIINDDTFVINNIGRIKGVKYTEFECTSKGKKLVENDWDVAITDFLI